MAANPKDPVLGEVASLGLRRWLQDLARLVAAGGGGGGAVSSVFGRTGAVVAASGDYTAAQVGAAATGHTHTFASLTSPPTTLAGYGITDAQPLDADLTALAGISANGLLAHTGVGTAAARSIAVPAAGLTITNGDGAAGNPTLALANDLAALEALSTTGGFAYRSATDTWAIQKGWERIASATLASAGTTLINQTTGISGYDLIRITIDLVGYAGSDTIQLTLNALANSHQYHWSTITGAAAAGAAVTHVGGTNQGTNGAVIKLAPANATAPRFITIEFGNRPEKTEKLLKIFSETGTASTGSAPAKDICSASVITAASTRISQIKLFTATQNMLAGSTVVIEGCNP